MPIPAALLRVIHGDVGVVDQDIAAAAERRAILSAAAGDADRNRHFHAQAVLLDRAGGCGHQFVGQAIDAFAVSGIVAQRADELVAPDAGHHGALRQKLDQPRGDLAQDAVAHGVAVQVVDLLEVVEIEHQHGHGVPALFGFVQQQVDRRHAAAPVEAAGQRIARSQLVRQRFCLAPFGDFAVEVLVAPPAEDQQGDVEQHRVGQQHVGRLGHSHAHGRADDLGHDRAPGAHEQDQRGNGDPQRDDVTLGSAQDARFPGLLTAR